jgi:hypothetical protein
MSNGAEPSSEHSPGPIWTLNWITTARNSLDVVAVLGNPRLGTLQFSLVSGAAVIGIALAIAGYVIGSFVAIFAVLFLVFSYPEPVLIWRIKRERHEFLGRPVTIRIDASGIESTSELGAGRILWSAVTSVRDTPRTVLFMRGQSALAYVPVAAFANEAERRAVVTFAQSHLGSSGAAGPSGSPARGSEFQ